ncbi:voltage-dependent T-type calcium channel subunit alpha-1H isoform X1 [Fundulus heteroclitus]|uniref:voltage-dependent T-type calcium channel subunit alpha-1H isoform X1 n=1 Tax=Fundulus heteroclitus TaxID=8078 RepID=UPI00165AEBFC|nr:voltage-dependent T-type calcium channel subunit alpha-1H isoform X1 [Fundulus heteroclitus]
MRCFHMSLSGLHIRVSDEFQRWLYDGWARSELTNRVMVDTFYKCQREQRQSKETESDPDSDYFLNYSWVRSQILKLYSNESMDHFITIIINASLLLMDAEHYEQSKSVRQFLDLDFYIITLVLVLQVVLKNITFGLVRFLKVGWNVLDIFIVLISIMSIVLTQLKLSNNIPSNPAPPV